MPHGNVTVELAVTFVKAEAIFSTVVSVTRKKKAIVMIDMLFFRYSAIALLHAFHIQYGKNEKEGHNNDNKN